MIAFYNLKIVEILDADLKAVLTTHRKLRFYLCHFYQKVPRHLWSLHRALIFDKKSHAMIWKSYCKLTESEGKAIFSIVLSVVHGAMALIFIS